MVTNLKINKKKDFLPDIHFSQKGYFRKNVCSNIKKENRPIKFFLSVLLSVLFFTPISANPKELATKYSIHILGANVGEFSVTQTDENGNINIEAITDIKINLLFSYHIKYVQHTVYNQGVLQSSHVETYKNGKLNSSMSLKYYEDSYQLVVDGDTTVINDQITYSGSLLYFNEPKGIKRLYKERSAEMRQINAVSEHVYIIKDEKDREINKYYYKDGILQYAKMRHALGNIELKQETITKVND